MARRCRKAWRAGFALAECRMIEMPPHRRAARGGFTVLETVLALALLAALAALVWPALRSPLAGQSLEAAADQVRTAWSRARVRAMTTGVTHVFYAVPQEAAYRIEPLSAPQGNLAAAGLSSGLGGRSALDPRLPPAGGLAPQRGSALSAAPASDEAQATAAPPALDPTMPLYLEARLPAEVVFALVQSSASEQVPPAQVDVLVGRSVGSGIFFYPDGTTSTAQVVLLHDEGLAIALELRGLTGVCTVGEVLSQQESLR
jgi:type II secretory pathway pseudopilin PulG